MTCTVVGNCLFFAIFQDKLRLKFLIARLIAIKIFNRPAALLLYITGYIRQIFVFVY